MKHTFDQIERLIEASETIIRLEQLKVDALKRERQQKVDEMNRRDRMIKIPYPKIVI